MGRPKKEQEAQPGKPRKVKTKEVVNTTAELATTAAPLDFGKALKDGFSKAMSLKTVNHPGEVELGSEHRDRFIPFRSLALQALMRSKGLILGTVVEILGQDGASKSSLCYWLAGDASAAGGIVLYINSEGKELTKSWKVRLMSEDVGLGSTYLDNVIAKPAETIQDCIRIIEQFVRYVRTEHHEYDHKPFLIIVDTYSKLMSPELEEGYTERKSKKKGGDDEKAKGPKDEAEVTKLGWSTMAHLWTSRLPYFLKKYNGALLVVSQQNVKIDMGGFASKFRTSESDNRTKRGGTAFNFAAISQMSLIKSGQVEDAQKNRIGIRVTAKCIKCGVGAPGTTFKYIVKQDLFADDPANNKLECPVQMSGALCDLLQDKKLFGLRLSNGMYNSAELGLRNASCEEVEQAIKNNPDHLAVFGNEFGIHGYEPEYTNYVPSGYKTQAFEEEDSIANIPSAGDTVDVSEEGTDDEETPSDS